MFENRVVCFIRRTTDYIHIHLLFLRKEEEYNYTEASGRRGEKRSIEPDKAEFTTPKEAFALPCIILSAISSFPIEYTNAVKPQFHTQTSNFSSLPINLFLLHQQTSAHFNSFNPQQALRLLYRNICGAFPLCA